MAWYPGADVSVRGVDAGSFTSGAPFRGLLHTTEGSGAAGAIGAFKTNSSWPHFLVDPLGKVWQFVDTNRAGKALRNLAGGVETNRQSCIQIEIVGFAGKPGDHSVAQVASLKALMRWIEKTHKIKPEGPGRPFATAYGQSKPRFTFAEWNAFNGWCGHCHAPEQDHWDPGAIDLASLLPAKEVTAMYSPNIVLEPIAAHLAYNGGTYLVADSGALYAFGAPGIGGPNGQPYFAGRHVARLYPGDCVDPEIPAYVGRVAGGLIIRTTSNEWYGPFVAKV